MNTAECMKKIRKALCFSQTDLSRALDVTVSTISCYERGTRKPSYPTVRKIMELAKKHKIKVDLDDIRPE